MKKMIAGKEFENVAGRWVYQISKRRNIVLIPEDGGGWFGRDLSVSKKGNFVEGTKKITGHGEARGKTLEEVAKKLLDNLEADDPLKKAQEKYQEKCKILTIRVNRETEADIIEWLEKNDGKVGTLIKEMIRSSLR